MGDPFDLQAGLGFAPNDADASCFLRKTSTRRIRGLLRVTIGGGVICRLCYGVCQCPLSHKKRSGKNRVFAYDRLIFSACRISSKAGKGFLGL